MNNGCQPNPKWAPQPDSGFGPIERHDYHAGYSDSFYEYPFGAGHPEPTNAYRLGWSHADEHRKAANPEDVNGLAAAASLPQP